MVVALLSTLPLALSAQDQEKQLLEVKERYLKSLTKGLKGRAQSPQGKKALDKMIMAGVNKLAKEKFSDEKMQLAEKNLSILAKEILKKAGDRQIDAAAVERALADLCPCFPWCPHPGDQSTRAAFPRFPAHEIRGKVD
jgi:hypothetical protein